VLDAATEDRLNFDKYDGLGVTIFVDKKIDPTDTVQIRVNPYRQKGKLSFRTLSLGAKETQWPGGPE
jgi:hypothetical protein